MDPNRPGPHNRPNPTRPSNPVDTPRPAWPALVAEVLAGLAAPATSAAQAEALMARLDGHEVEALLPAFRELHDAADEGVLHASARLLARWSEHPVAAALKPALNALLGEPAVPDLNKLVAAGLLEILGEPVNLSMLRRAVADPAAVARHALGVVLAKSADPFAVLHFLDGLADAEPELVLAVAEDLAHTKDVRAGRILGPLTWSADDEIAQVARTALAELRRARSATPALDARRAAYPGNGRSAPKELKEPEEPKESAPQKSTLKISAETTGTTRVAAYLSAPGADSGRLAVLVVPSASDPDLRDVLTIYVTNEAGVRKYGSMELLGPAQVDALLGTMADGGVVPRPADAADVAQVLEAAAERTRATGGARAVGWAVWRQILC